MNTWPARVKSRMKELGITQELLANKMGITRGAIGHYLSGLRQPPLPKFQKLAAILKVDPAWLQFGTKPNTFISQDKPKKEKQLSLRNIPIISWKQASEHMNVSNIDNKEITHSIPHIYTDKSAYYALKLTNDSMTAPAISPKSFHEGDIIIVDPDKNPIHGSLVVAIIPSTQEATFKQYVVDAGIIYLKPLNPQYPTVKINNATHICGVVISSFKFI